MFSIFLLHEEDTTNTSGSNEWNGKHLVLSKYQLDDNRISNSATWHATAATTRTHDSALPSHLLKFFSRKWNLFK